MKSFEDLEVWQRSCRLSVDIYKSLQKSRDFALKDQMCRASVSVASNIAEGSERGTDKDFVRFLNIAKGSAAELRTQLYISAEIGLLPDEVSRDFIVRIKEISKMIQGLITFLKRNC